MTIITTPAKTRKILKGFFLTVSTVLLALTGEYGLAVIYLLTFTSRNSSTYSRTVGKLVPTSAIRFIRKHADGHREWASSIGFRTGNFYVDHDPLRSIHHSLPTSLNQIRSEEIQRRIKSLVSHRLIHQHSFGGQIFGVLDPEQCVTSCCDILKMFSCLYLDAGPVVERRLKGLTTLLPIIEPALADYLASTPQRDLVNRNQWFFFCDYSWVDQHILETPSNANYEVGMSQFIYNAKDILAENLKSQSIDLSNCIWVSISARDQLVQECSYLQDVLEPYPIFDPIKKEDHIFFRITFDQLVPRLQMYEELDKYRQRFVDFEPSLEHLSILDLVERRSASDITPATVSRSLELIQNIQWQGFKEKDLALHAVVKLYHATCRQLNNNRSICSSGQADLDHLHQKFLQTVLTIGYPSQTLHKALLNKQNFRQIENLIAIAKSPHHQHFKEAWHFLTNTNLSQISSHQEDELEDLIKYTARFTSHQYMPYVQAKAVQAGIHLIRHQSGYAPLSNELSQGISQGRPHELIAIMHQWLMDSSGGLEVWKLFLSSLIFLERNYPGFRYISSVQINDLERHWRDLPDTNHLPYALRSRLSELKNVIAIKEAACKKAG